ncbi:MAG: Dabb family protein [Planctomycetaceae bacterium]
MLAHNVYFSLNDNSPAAIDRMVAACHKYLKDHPGVEFYAAGKLSKDLTRPVNDLNFDVALARGVYGPCRARRVYQTAPAHLKFIEENKPSWKQVRVFDSYVDG